MGDEETTRSGLFYEAVRVIKEMRENDKRSGRADEFIRPRYAVYENVPGALSSNSGEDWRCVLEEIARVIQEDAVIPRPANGKWSNSGLILLDGGSIAWRVHDAQFWGKTIFTDDRVRIWGTPQRRRRIALVADFGAYTAGEILFERKSVSRNPDEEQEKRKEAAEAARRCALGSIWDDGDRDSRVPIVDSIGGQHEAASEVDVSPVIKATHYKNPPCIADEPILLESNQNHATIQTDGKSTTLPASMGMGGGYVPMITGGSDAYSFQERAGKPGGGKGILVQKERIGAMVAGNVQSVCFAENEDNGRDTEL